MDSIYICTLREPSLECEEKVEIELEDLEVGFICKNPEKAEQGGESHDCVYAKIMDLVEVE